MYQRFYEFSMKCLFIMMISLSASATEQLYTVDVLGLYSDPVAHLVADPRARFVSYLEYSNKALENSGANYRYHLVHLQQLSWPNDHVAGETQLRSLQQDDTVRHLRAVYGADLVAALVPQNGNSCGIGYISAGDHSTQQFFPGSKAYGFSVVAHNCGGRALAHELGHNMGLGHSPAQASQGSLAFWGRGFGHSEKFVTIMAYGSSYQVSSGAGRIQIHSNPELVVCQGLPCGQYATTEQGADAKQALDLAAPQVAGWSETKVQASESDFAETDNESVRGLIKGGDIESGLANWHGSKTATLRESADAHSGQVSLMVREARWVSIPITREIEARDLLEASVWVKVLQSKSKITLSILYHGLGQWRLHRMANREIPPGRWVQLKGEINPLFSVPGAQLVIETGGSTNEMLIDDVLMTQ